MKDEFLSAHFRRREFACRCGCGFGLGDGDVDPGLVRALEDLRFLAGRPVKVNSACRCSAHNARQGGKAASQHLKGKAADVKINGLSPKEVARLAERVAGFRDGGIGVYAWGVHLDVRGQRARW